MQAGGRGDPDRPAGVAMIEAILRAQLLSMRKGGRGRVFSIITGSIVVRAAGWWSACAAFLGVSGASAEKLRLLLPLGALAVCLYWQVMPILSASMGSSLDMRKLMVYPVPHAKLFQVEVLLRLTTGVEMLMVLAGSVAGLFRNPASAGWLRAARGADLHRVQSAAGQRHAQSVGTAAFQTQGPRVSGVCDFHVVDAAAIFIRERPPAAPDGRLGEPDAECRVAVDRGRVGGAGALRIPGTALAGGWTLLAAWFGRTQFERNLRFDAVAAQATPYTNGVSTMQAAAEAFYRFPARWLRDPMGAIVEKELRSLARTPRYRMVFVMGFSFGLMVWLPMILGRPRRRDSPSCRVIS